MVVESRVARVVARGVRRGPYRKYTLDSKRAIVRECLVRGASVAGVALAHGVNANLVRKWILKYRAGEYGAAESGVRLLPVTVRETAGVPVPNPSAPAVKGHIDIELPAGRVRVRGQVDAEALRTVLASLLR
jgi:transposase